VPGDDASETRGFHEQLVVPEPHGTGQELARGNQDRRVPEKIVKRGRDAPRAERVEEDPSRLERLVRMSFVEEVRSGMRRVEKRLELGTEELDLILVEYPQACEKSVAVECGKLLG
jgi:hypothetical protein